MSAECTLKTCPKYLIPNHPQLRGKKAISHRQMPTYITRAICLSVPVAAIWFLHMEPSSNFSDTYPLKYQRLVSDSSPRRKKVFDGVAVRSSLWHVSKAGSPQMRWLPVAWEAAGPCLQIWGCATNQVIALSRVHPLQLGRTPSTSCTPRWGEWREQPREAGLDPQAF